MCVCVERARERGRARETGREDGKEGSQQASKRLSQRDEVVGTGDCQRSEGLERISSLTNETEQRGVSQGKGG